ncbi:MAG TPA: hypothetical protein VF909_19380, partial [Roseiflexaceae bacterium]
SAALAHSSSCIDTTASSYSARMAEIIHTKHPWAAALYSQDRMSATSRTNTFQISCRSDFRSLESGISSASAKTSEVLFE